jgi:hypothetical protein
LRDRRICFAFSAHKQQILRSAQDDTSESSFSSACKGVPFKEFWLRNGVTALEFAKAGLGALNRCRSLLPGGFSLVDGHLELLGFLPTHLSPASLAGDLAGNANFPSLQNTDIAQTACVTGEHDNRKTTVTVVAAEIEVCDPGFYRMYLNHFAGDAGEFACFSMAWVKGTHSASSASALVAGDCNSPALPKMPAASKQASTMRSANFTWWVPFSTHR